MGIKVLDEVKTQYGVLIANLVYSCRGAYKVEKQADAYRVIASFEVRAANDPLLPPLMFDAISVPITLADLSTNLLSSIVYPALKAKFLSVEDL